MSSGGVSMPGHPGWWRHCPGLAPRGPQRLSDEVVAWRTVSSDCVLGLWLATAGHKKSLALLGGVLSSSLGPELAGARLRGQGEGAPFSPAHGTLRAVPGNVHPSPFFLLGNIGVPGDVVLISKP